MTDRQLFPAGCFGVSPDRVYGPTSLGGDVRPGSYDCSVLEWVNVGEAPDGAIRYTPKLVFYGKLPDEQLAIFVLRQYRVRAALVDSAPDYTVVRRMQQAMRGAGKIFWRASYNTVNTAGTSQVKITPNEKEGILKLERTLALDDLHWRYFTQQILVPQNYRDICGGQFVGELTSMTRIETPWHGQSVMRWEKSGADHAMHCLSYALAVAEFTQLTKWGYGALGPQKGLMAGQDLNAPADDNSVEGRWVSPDGDDGGLYLEA